MDDVELEAKGKELAQKCWDEDEEFLAKEKIAEWLGKQCVPIPRNFSDLSLTFRVTVVALIKLPCDTIWKALTLRILDSTSPLGIVHQKPRV